MKTKKKAFVEIEMLLGFLILLMSAVVADQFIDSSLLTANIAKGWGDASVELIPSTPPKVKVTENVDGILSITVRWIPPPPKKSWEGRAYYFPTISSQGYYYPPVGTGVKKPAPKEFTFTLQDWGKTDWYVIGIVDGGSRVDSTWLIYKDGRVIRRWPQ